MKYEEWIKYEEVRQNQPPELAWMVWVEYPAEEPPLAVSLQLASQTDEDKPAARVWSLIVQYLNSRRI
ncbi:MAG TPA: hypothetical protein VJ965_11390 [Anaerolineales bacterium]|nr:hypothetical protein [Anaerolineales bacterium]